VTQWDSQTHLHNLLGDDTCVYTPSGDIHPSPVFEEDDKVLVLEGGVVDVIDTVSNMFAIADIIKGSSTVADLWNQLPEGDNGDFTTDVKYRNTQEPALFAYLETLSAVKKRKQQAPIPYSQRIADGADFLAELFGGSHNIGHDVRQKGLRGDSSHWMERVSGGVKCRRFARGNQGYYALCPPAARKGDVLCLLLGGQTLFCLRPSDGDYQFVGECYVHGVMDGEALDMLERGELPRTTFRIR
jgi:hypothetical protein